MRYNRIGRFGGAMIAAGAALLACAGAAYSQQAQAQQDQSVADAARQARAAKKNAAAKPAKVISDDDIDVRSVKPGAEGLHVGSEPRSGAVPPAPAAVAAMEATDAAAAAAETNPQVKVGESPEIASAKQEVAEVEKQLNLLQRGFALDQDSYYSKPDYAADRDGKAKLDAGQQQIRDKQQELDRAKARLAELNEAWKANKHAGAGNAGEAVKPAEAPAGTPPQS
jgi:type I restriction-modification system DNA methylase subunit